MAIPVYASNLDRVAKCPASAGMYQNIKTKIPSTFDATEGTRRHKEIQEYIESNGEKKPLDPLVIEAVKILDEIIAPEFLEAEKKLWSELLQSNIYVDAVAQEAQIIVDFKFGFQEVEAEGNKQLLAAMSALKFDARRPTKLIIIQPQSETPKKQVIVDIDYINKYWPEIVHIVTSAREDNPKFNVGSHCLTCSARHQCGAINNLQKGLVDHITAKENEVNYSDFELGQELTILDELSEIVKARKSALSAIAEHKISEGGAVPGWGMKNGRGSRTWIDEEKAIEIIESAGHDAYEKTLLTPAKAEKLVKKSLLKNYIKTIPGKRKLSPMPTAAQILTKEG